VHESVRHGIWQYNKATSPIRLNSNNIFNPNIGHSHHFPTHPRFSLIKHPHKPYFPYVVVAGHAITACTCPALTWHAVTAIQGQETRKMSRGLNTSPLSAVSKWRRFTTQLIPYISLLLIRKRIAFTFFSVKYYVVKYFTSRTCILECIRNIIINFQNSHSYIDGKNRTHPVCCIFWWIFTFWQCTLYSKGFLGQI